MDPRKSLTRREFEEVIRRASELAASEPDAGLGELDEAELFRIAEEVGLPARHIRRALAELRDAPAERTFIDRVLGPEVLRVGRTVSGSRRELGATLNAFFVDTQLLDPVRRTPSLLQYRPAVDWVSRIARAASATSGRYYVASADHVEVSLEPVEEDRTAVLLEVDPGTRRDYVVRGVVGAAALALAAGIGVATLLAAVSTAPIWLATVAGVVAGGAGASAVVALAGSAHRRKLAEVRAEMEGILDQLEAGESLEPPPPSWRRWVRRQFHGVAREMLGSENDHPEGRGGTA